MKTIIKTLLAKLLDRLGGSAPVAPVAESKPALKISAMALAASGTKPEPEAPQAQFQRYEPPAGVLPSGMAMDAAMAMDATPYDVVNGMYAGAGPFKGFPYLARLAQQPEYRKIVETIARQMTRKWIKVKAKGEVDKSARVSAIEDALDAFKVRDVFRRAAELDGFFGRGQIYIDVMMPGGALAQDDPAELALPLLLKPEKITKGGLAGFRVVEPVWTYPSMYDATNPLAADFYKPKSWYVMGKTVHASRLLLFVSRPLPNLLQPAYNFSGLSMSQLVEPAVLNWLRTRDSVSDLVHAFSVSGIKTNMASVLAGGGGDDLMARAQLFNNFRDNKGLFALDKDTEEFFQFNVPLGGLDHLQAQAQEQTASTPGIPLIYLLGTTPSGLNATSEGEIKVFHETIRAEQETLFRAPLNIVFEVLQLHLFGAIDPDIGFEFEALDEMDPMQQAQIRKTDADTDAVLVGAGVISPDESRGRMAGDESSPYHGLEENAELGNQDDEAPAQDEAIAFDGEHWITVSGARVMIDEHGKVIGGAGGKLDGKTLNPKTKSANRINEKTSQFSSPDFRPHEPAAKTRPVEHIKADIAAVEREYKEREKGVKAAARNDQVHNEGGGGYSHSEALSEKSFNQYREKILPLKEELFAATWTPEVTKERRAKMNSEIVKTKSYGDLAKLQARLGYTVSEIKEAMKMHGIT